MVNEVFSPTSNNEKGAPVGGVSSSDSVSQIVLRLDPTTKRLLVDASISSYTGVTDGEAVDAADTGTLILGTDGTNYQVVSTDSSGRLVLGASSLAIGKLAANSGVDIGDVDVTSVPTDPFGANADAASATGSISAKLRFIAATGIPITGTVAVTQSGTWDEVGINDSGNNISIDWGGTVPPIGAGLEATALRVTLATDSTGLISIDDNGSSITVDSANLVTLAGAVSGTEMQVDVVAALPAGTNNIGDVDILSIAAGDNNIGNVDVATSALPTGASTLAEQQTQTTHLSTIAGDTTAIETAIQIMDDWDNAASDGASVSGDVAHDSADAGEPVKIGGKAISAEPAVVTANDRVNALFDLVGKLIVLPYANPENFVSGAITSAMTGTTSTSLIAAPASGLRNYITQITVSNAHATVGTDIIIQDGSGGTTLYTIPAAAVYGGATLTFPTPLRQPTTATAIFCANVTTGASTKVSASGYKGV